MNDNIQTVYGPVLSRRLGRSLGVDPIPLKTCNWNCVYCQIGRTVPLSNERREYHPRQLILDQVKETLATLQPDDVDWISFVGSGEPTLHSGLGWLLRQVKMITHHPIAVITNGALLYLPEVREALAVADAVLPSLDAGSADLYRRINRPHPTVTFERLIEGLIAFRRQYQGQLWIEVMLVEGLNDTEEALHRIAGWLQQIRPDAVHINLPNRPPAETWVRPPDQEGLWRAEAILGQKAAVVTPVEGQVDLSQVDDLLEAIIGIISRHPMSHAALLRGLAEWAPGQSEEVRLAIEESGRVQVVERYGVKFWSAAPARYPDEEHSQAAAPGAHDRPVSSES